MKIQELYQKAMKFAGEKHKNQKVPGTNSNYLLHLGNVSMEILVAHNLNDSFDLEFAVQIAILHDTIEDTETSFNEIKSEFGEQIAKAIMALTKDKKLNSKNEIILDSLCRINKLEKEVGIVKIADRITNLQKPPKHWNTEKIKNYLIEAKIISKSLENKNNFLNSRLIDKIKEYEDYT